MKKSIVILLHIAYWLLYWIVSSFFVIASYNSSKHFPIQFYFLSPIPLAAILPGIVGFYTCYLFLFDRYLVNKKIIQLITAIIGTAIIASALSQVLMYLVLADSSINWSLNTCLTMGSFLAFIAIIHSATGMVMQGFIKWFGDIKVKAELTKKNYETELALLKSQINPHFLFNTINNIDMLITKDPVSASNYLNKLSAIMRFMLYETKTEKIPLLKELSYIEKFIELQKIRTSNAHYIDFKVNGDTAAIMIPPMLFIPFIENAFKHCGNKKIENAIIIQFDIEQHQIKFRCENNFTPNLAPKQNDNGLGSELIEKRLALLYPDKHKLVITKNNDIYKVDLTLH